MAVLNKDVVDKSLVMAGTFGNLAVGENMKYITPTVNPAVIGDEIVLGIIPAGSHVVSFKSVREALGASATMDLGYRAVNPASALAAALTYWGAVVAMATAGVTDSAAVPITFNEAVYIIGTVKGANPATGKLIQVYPHYIYRNI